MFKQNRTPLFILILFILAIFQFSDSVVSHQPLRPGHQKKIQPKTKNPGCKIIPDVNFGNIPLYFIHNKGQVHDAAVFYAKTPGYTLWITKEGLVFDSIRIEGTGDRRQGTDRDQRNVSRDVSRLLFIGANRNPEIIPLEIQKLKINYFKGNSKSNWVGGVPTSGTVLYKNLYKNIDLKVYGIGKQIEYDWIIHPGGDPSGIKFEYKNVKKIKINKKGDLDITTQFGTLIHKKPFAYQQSVGANGDSPSNPSPNLSQRERSKKEISSAFKKFSKTTFGFTTGKYDRNKILIIDPVVLAYSTYLGGSGFERGMGIDADNNGYVYIIGYTESTDFPALNQYELDDIDTDVFISKIDTSQSGTSSLIYSSYLGGSGYDTATSIFADDNGYAYISGFTYSSDYPVLNQYQGDNNDSDAFVTKLDTTQNGPSGLLYSTYLGGDNIDFAHAIETDDNEIVYVTGTTFSSDFPVLNEYQGDQPERDIFITRLDTKESGSSSLLYSTYLGGNGYDFSYGIEIDANNYIYITGETLSSDFPIFNHFQTDQTGIDAFITKIDPYQSGAQSLLYSTYLGGNSTDTGNSISLDSSEIAYITGNTDSTDFPIRDQIQKHQGFKDVFVTKVDTTLSGNSSLLFSTYFGGSRDDIGKSIDIDESGYPYITGYSESSNFPVLNHFQDNQGDYDAFIFKINTNGDFNSTLIFSTYLGGSGFDEANGIVINHLGQVFVVGSTRSSNFPTFNQYQGDQPDSDAFLIELSMGFDINCSVSGGNGSVSPVSQTTIQGQTASINLNPAPGYMVGSINDNGINTVVQNPYRIYNVQDDHDVIVTFKELVYKVTAEVDGGNGEISPADQWVRPGENASITITPFTGYRIASITDNGNPMTISNPYIIQSVHTNHSVKVRFLPDAYPPEITLSGIRKTDGSWTMKKEFAEIKISIIEHPFKPLEIGSYVLFKSVNGKWKFLQIFETGGEHTYIDIPLITGEKEYYKVVAYVLDGSRATESEILEL